MKEINIQTLRWAVVVLGSFGFVLMAPSLHSDITLAAGETACGTITSSTGLVPTGFGVPYNVLSSAKENLIDAQCSSSTGGATINVGSGRSDQYIYNTGYIYKDNQWNPIIYRPGTGAGATGVWITAKAKADLSSNQLTDVATYVLAYICQRSGSAWKCGCRDNTCTTPMWQLQIVQPPPLSQPSGTKGQACTSDAQCGVGFSCWVRFGGPGGIKGSPANPGTCYDNTALPIYNR